MEDVGIFEAKTKFPSLCDQVVRNGTPILVRRRGKPLVVLSPAEYSEKPSSEGILTQWEAWEADHKDPSEEEFPEVWKLRNDKTESPLEEQP